MACLAKLLSRDMHALCVQMAFCNVQTHLQYLISLLECHAKCPGRRVPAHPPRERYVGLLDTSLSVRS